MNAISMKALKTINRCIFNRENAVKYGEKIPYSVKVHEIIVNCIIDFQNKKINDERLKEICLHMYDEDEDILPIQKEIYGMDRYDEIKRYLKAETRVPQKAEASVLNMWGCLNVNVYPDVYFYDGKSLEVVLYEDKKPDISQNGYSLDKSVKGSLLLYSLLYYAKSLAEYLNPDTPIPVTASIYFLKHKGDKLSKNVFEDEFVEEGKKNIISLKDTSIWSTQIDMAYYKLLQDFIAGVPKYLDKEECRKCSLYDVCFYKKTPEQNNIFKDSGSVRNMRPTDEQKQAIYFSRGIARINAGAGTGKTFVIGLRNCNLFYKGIKPEEVVNITFTNAAANEMKERIKKYTDDFGINIDYKKLRCNTFNSLGDTIIAENYAMLGFTKVPTVIEDGENNAIIEELILDNVINGIDYRYLRSDEKNLQGGLALAKKLFEIFKNEEITINSLDRKIETIIKKIGYDIDEELIKKIYPVYVMYCQRLKEENLVTFADEELLMFEVNKKNPEYFKKTGIKHIIIDEFQDSNNRQLKIIKLLMQSEAFESLIVVGDDAQSIYGFRDTSPYNIINFFDVIGKEGQDFYLLKNYRSVPDIINVANEIIGHNTIRVDKKLQSTLPNNGQKPFIQAYARKETEYASIVDRIEKDLKAGRKPEDIAVIARKKSELLSIQQLLNNKGIKNILLNPELVKENSKICAVIGLFDFIFNPTNEKSIVSYVNAVLENTFFGLKKEERSEYISYYTEYAAEFQEKTSEEKFNEFQSMISVLKDDTDELFNNFLSSLERYSSWSGLCRYLKNFVLYGDKNTYTKVMSYSGVALITAHSSKGLEWPVVYASITDFDDKSFDSSGALAEIEETRRLLFVTITRAKEKLSVTSKYWSYGDAKTKNFNRFMKELYNIQNRDLASEYEDKNMRM